jgi:hypothetical protein
MKKYLPITLSSILFFIFGFGFAIYLFSGYQSNPTASNNFQTAIEIFKQSYSNKSVHFFGENQKSESFSIGNFQFHVTPARKTLGTSYEHTKQGNISLSNIGAHINSMVIMLACKWVEDKNPNGKTLLKKLQEHIPNYMTSAPGIGPVPIKNLSIQKKMISNEASQWSWRMK